MEGADILLKFVDGGHVVGFNKRTVTALTCELATAGRDIVVILAVGSRGELFEELQVCECGGIDSCGSASIGFPRVSGTCAAPTSLLKWGC